MLMLSLFIDSRGMILLSFHESLSLTDCGDGTLQLSPPVDVVVAILISYSTVVLCVSPPNFGRGELFT